MDYLLRDSYFCGVSYGGYDLDWLLDNLEICIDNNEAYLGITERAVVTFDDFLLSRYHMFVMVYFHYRAVCLEQLLYKYFDSSPDEYKIPANIEEYIEHDDHHLMKIMRNSKNRYAGEIVQNKIPAKVYESFNDPQLENLALIQQFFKDESIEYIRCSSKGRLSKYYEEDKPANPFSMRVVRKYFGTDKKTYSNIDEATELFQKFSKSHAINRLHCYTETMNQSQLMELSKLCRK
jgi:HD superfamily phosphohydrolase